MKVEKKIENFSKAAVAEAEVKAEELVKEYEEKFAEAKAVLEAEYEAELQAQLAEELRKIKEQHDKETLKAIKAVRYSLSDLRESLADELFDRIFQQLVDYVETEDYVNSMRASIGKLVESHGQNAGDTAVQVLLCPRDYIIFTDLGGVAGAELLEDNENSLGGYRAKVNGTRLSYDCRFNLDGHRHGFVGVEIED